MNGQPTVVLPTNVTYSGADNQNGAFSAVYDLGSSSLGFLSAILNDRAGGSTTLNLPESFSGTASTSRGIVAHGDTYSADGSELLTSTNYKKDGSQVINVAASGLTLHSNFFDTFNNHGAPNNAFVFDPGHGLDVVNQFRVNGTDHDSLSFLGSDFGSTPVAQLASVLANTTNTAQGAVITDPTSGDTVRLAGITKAELKVNQGDFSFHS